MKRTKKEKQERLREVAAHFANGGKVVVKDIDGSVKESGITAVYADFVVVLGNCIQAEWPIFNITLIPRKEEEESDYHELFEYMHETFDVIAMQTEMQEIVEICKNLIV